MTQINKHKKQGKKVKKNCFFLNENNYINPTAIEIQACLRAQMFHEYLHIMPTIICHTTDTYLKHNFVEYQNSSHIQSNTPIFSVINFYCDKIKPAKESNNQSFKWRDDFRYEVDETHLNFKAYIKDKLQVYISHHPQTKLVHYINFIEHTDKPRIIKRDVYDEQGYLSQIGVVNPDTEQETVRYFLDRTGRVRVTYHYDEKGNVSKILTTNTHGMVIGIFNSEKELLADFIEKLSEQHKDDEVYFIADRSIYYQALQTISNSRHRVLTIIHSHLFENDAIEKNIDFAVIKELQHYVGRSQNKLITLSQEHQQDLEKYIGKSDNICAIPNLINNKIDTKSIIRNRFSLVALTRLSPEKQPEKLIAMFAQVKKSIPQATLDIYGVGELHTSLQKQIDDLELSESVTLKGYTDKPYEVFAQAGLSLLTSKSETFSMVVLESLLCGCPVVSFDVAYGPSSMITDGENGYLIPVDNITMMANKIIALLNNPILYEQMSDNARKEIFSYSVKKVFQRWEKLLDIK